MKNNLLGTAIPKCFFCGDTKNVLILNTRLNAGIAKKVNDMHGKVIDLEPCTNCKKLMEQGVMLISVKDGTDSMNPYRTGNMAVVRDEGIKRMFKDEGAENLIKTRFGFIEDTCWKDLGLPTATEYEEETKETPDA